MAASLHSDNPHGLFLIAVSAKGAKIALTRRQVLLLCESIEVQSQYERASKHFVSSRFDSFGSTTQEGPSTESARHYPDYRIETQ